MLCLIVMYSVVVCTLSGTASAQCPSSWILMQNQCYMNSSVLSNHSDAVNVCGTAFGGAKLAVLETDTETAAVFRSLGLTNETRYAIGPFPPCGNDTCYFVIGRASGAYQVGSVPCDTTLPFICEGSPFYEEPKQVRSVDPLSTTSESVTISWERPDNVSSYRVTLEKYQTNRQAESRSIDAEDPREVIFDGLDGGTQYRAAIYSVYGPKESVPHILEFCTIPCQIPCVQHSVKKDLILNWTPSPGRVTQYRIEINTTNKDGWSFEPAYTRSLDQTFDKVLMHTSTKYAVTAQAVIWCNGQELLSDAYVHIIEIDVASQEDKSDPCENVPDYVRKPPSPVPNDAEDITVSNIATDSLTINWTSRSNDSSFHVTAVDNDGYSPNAKRRIAAHEPKTAVFDSLQGGTEYTVAVFTFNGTMDSDPVTLTVATLPSQIPVIYAAVKEGEIKVTWAVVPGYADDYLFELVEAVDKNNKPVYPIYAGGKDEIKFKDLVKKTDYIIEAYAVVWFKADRLLSPSKTLDVTTPSSGTVHFDSKSVTRLPTSSPTTQAMTTAEPELFCPQINYEPTTTPVPTTTAVKTTTVVTTQATTEQQTTPEITQPSTTQVEPTTTPVQTTTAVTTTTVVTTQATTEQQTTPEKTQPPTTQVEPTTTRAPSTAHLTTQRTTQQPTTTSPEPTTPQQTTMNPTTGGTTSQETTVPTVTPSVCESFFHEPPTPSDVNTPFLFAQQTFDFVNRSLNFFFNQFGDGSPNPNDLTPGEVADTWECFYKTRFTAERELKLVPDLLEALLQGFLMSAKWAPTIQVKGHPFAGGTDVEIWRSDNQLLEGCGNYSRVHEEPSRLTFDIPNSAIADNGTSCRSLLVMKMENVGDLLPQDGCSDEGEFHCDEVETPFPLVTVALNPAKPPPFIEPVTFGFQRQNEVPGYIPVCVWLETKRQANRSESLRGYSWNSSGCDTITEKGAITCRCNHLTSFSVIIRVAGYEVEEEHERALQVIGMLGCITTIICACLTIAIYAYLRILKEEKIIHTQFLSSIALSQLIFLIGIDINQYEVLCKVVSIALFYFFSATFAWMLVETCHLYLSVVRVFSSGSKFKVYFFVGWGLPAISVVITSAVGLSRDELISKDYCWLPVQSGLIWGFAGPALVIIMVNTVMLVAVLREISRLIERDITKMKANKFRTTAKAMLVFMPMVGLPWIFGFFALNSSLVVFDYIFTTLNSFQGLSLFMILVVGNKEVRNRIRGRIDDLNRGIGEKTTGCDNRVSVVPSALSTTGTSVLTALPKESRRTDEDKRSWGTPCTKQGTDDEGDVIVTSVENTSEGDLSAI